MIASLIRMGIGCTTTAATAAAADDDDDDSLADCDSKAGMMVFQSLFSPAPLIRLSMLPFPSNVRSMAAADW